MPPTNHAVVEVDVRIATPDGVCEAAFLHPESGSHPAVIVWADALGLRPSMQEIGRRIAAAGYSALVPNPYYRVAEAPLPFVSHFNFQDPADIAKLQPLMASVNPPGAVERDAEACVAFLARQKAVDPARKIGAQGYCLGGRLVVRTAAALPDRIAAGASFHGGGLVTDKPDSPHLLAPRIQARMYFAIAGNDDSRQPDAKDKLQQAFAAARVPAAIEVYPQAMHGWCVPDMPAYSHPDAERAWDRLLALYHAALP
jgi:carboxymethylenebutenolidase